MLIACVSIARQFQPAEITSRCGRSQPPLDWTRGRAWPDADRGAVRVFGLGLKWVCPVGGNNRSISMNEESAKFTFVRKKQNKRVIKQWTIEEDELLLELSRKYRENWSLIASFFPSRNINQCLHRFRRVKGFQNKKQTWTPSEDELVLKMVEELGPSWGLISKELKNKSGKQIRQRYINKLDPSINNGSWTKEQDHVIIKMYNQIGSRWNDISKALIGRPENKVKNRFYSHIKRFYLTEKQDVANLKLDEASQPVDLVQLDDKELSQPGPPELGLKAQQPRELAWAKEPSESGSEHNLLPLDLPHLREKTSFFKCLQPVAPHEWSSSFRSIYSDGLFNQ